MRPRIVDWLSALLGQGWGEYLVPSPSSFYPLAMIAMLVLFVRRGRGVGERPAELAAAAFSAMLGGVLGAHAFYWAQHGEIGGDGTASWGAYIGAAAGLAFYRWMTEAPILPILDLAASVAGLGIAIGRLSCFLYGDDWGTVTAVPWAVRFPPGSYAFADQVGEGLLDPAADLSLAVHPVQLYLGLNGAVLFLLLSHVWPRLRARPGFTLALYLALYAVGRFALEFYRGDQVRYTGLGLSVPQLMSACTLCLAVWYLTTRRVAPDGAPAARARLPLTHQELGKEW